MWELLATKIFWITAAVFAAYIYLKHYLYTYWQRHGVPCEQPSLLLGNIPFKHFQGKISIGNFIKENYEKFCKHPFHGFYVFFRPVIVVNDPELIKIILVKEFHKFHDRGLCHNDKLDQLSGHLLVMSGENWKNLRLKLSPIFTSGKLKQMFPIFVGVSERMLEALNYQLTYSDVIDLEYIISRYTTDVITTIVYGFKSKRLGNLKNAFHLNVANTIMFNKFSLFLNIFFPEFLEKFNLSISTFCSREFFISIFKFVVEDRRCKKLKKKDFLNFLIQLMNKGRIEDDEEKITNGTTNDSEKLDIIQAAAQAFVFFVAGHQTASSTTIYALLELALNQDIQDRLRQEVDQMAETTGITYDSVMGNEYLDMVLKETLRKYSSVPVLSRICTENFQIPNSNYTIPKGMRVFISTSGIHRNPEFYPNPDTFDPMRFSKENAAARSNYVQLGFGEGPRFCIGKHFGMLQVKQAIVAMLLHYRFYVCEKTEVPVKYTINSLVQYPESGIYLRVEQRRN